MPPTPLQPQPSARFALADRRATSQQREHELNGISSWSMRGKAWGNLKVERCWERFFSV